MRRRLPILLLVLLPFLQFLAAPAAAQGYEEGLKAFEAGDTARAETIWTRLAEAGDALGMYGLGKLYETGGAGVAADYARSAAWYEKAADGGVTAALNNLALLYAQGRGVDSDPARAVALWRQAGERGHPQAQYNLGLALYRGAGVERDIAAAAQWFRRAADNGLAEAQFALGEMHRLGVGLPQDLGLARTWYERAKAQGHPVAARQADKLAELNAPIKEPAPLEPLPISEQAAQASASGTAATPAPPVALAPEAPAPAKTAEPAVAAPARTAAVPPVPKRRPPGAAAPPPADAAPPPQAAAAPAPAAPLPADAADSEAAAPPPGTYSTWIGSMKTPQGAQRLWQEALRKHAALLEGLAFRRRRVEIEGSGVFYRALAGVWPERAAATRLCAQIREQGDFCDVVKN